MDSMRSLNTSLPAASSPRRQRTQPPEHLLQVFKQAALSVTNLYKAAASEHDKAYREGYQDAIEELLSFLDKENLGLQDGEGWRVRRWATERFEGTSAATAANASESDDEVEDDNKAQREPPPSLLRKSSQDLLSQQAAIANLRPSPSHTRSESAPPITAAAVVDQTPLRSNGIQSYSIPQADFTFRSAHEMDMDTAENTGTVHINVVPRPSRNLRQNSRTVNRTGSALGPGAGMKRRLPNFDFFDLGGFNGRDGFGGTGGGGGGGKRGRFT
jgi:hypothetical protein